MAVPQGPGLGVERRRRRARRGAGRGTRLGAPPPPSGRWRWAACPAFSTSRACAARRLARPAAGRLGVALVERAGEREQRQVEAARAAARPARARPARRCAGARPASAGPGRAGPARWASTSASDWSANSGWRSQMATISSIGAVSIQAASFSSASRRARAGSGAVDAGAGAHGHERRVARRARAARRAAPGGRRASSPRARRPPPPRRSRAGGPRRCARVVEEDARIAFRQPLGHRRPGVAGLHEAGDEDARVHAPSMIPINRTYAPLQALVDELARCGMRHAVTCPGSRNAPLIAHAGGARGGSSAPR